jgi:hypothetical protein
VAEDCSEILLAGFVTVGSASAGTLRLRSGQSIEGTFLGADSREVKFLGPNGQHKTYPLTEVAGITFAATPSPETAAAPPPKPAKVTLLAGTLIAVRMVDSLDTKTTHTGGSFHSDA